MPRSTYRIVCLAVLGLATLSWGCSSDRDTNTSVPKSAVAKPELAPPEGNTEPPLADVANAVDSIPSADGGAAAAITATVVTPEQFQDVIAKHRGKVVLVDFWATWCGPCRKFFPHTVALHQKLASQGFTAVSMAFDDADAKADVDAFLTEHHANFDNLMSNFGGESESYSAYDIKNEVIPHFRLYDRTGKLRHTFAPDIEANKGIDPAAIDKAVAELLAEGN